MKDQINTIREALEAASEAFDRILELAGYSMAAEVLVEQAIVALDALEAAMREPVAEVMPRRIGPGHGTPEKFTYDVNWFTVDPHKWSGKLFAAPVAQQPNKVMLEKLREWEANGELIDRALRVLLSQEQEIMRLEKMRAEERAQQPQADSIPVAAFDRLMALCESQAQRIIELEDKQPQADTLLDGVSGCTAQDQDRIDQAAAMLRSQQPQAECRSDGRCQYAIDHGAEGLGHCPEGKCAMKQPQAEVAEVFYCKTCGAAMQMPHDDCLACERGAPQ